MKDVPIEDLIKLHKVSVIFMGKTCISGEWCAHTPGQIPKYGPTMEAAVLLAIQSTPKGN